MTDNEHWDLVIEPKAHLFDLKLKEVWHYRDLLWLFVKRDFSAQYKQTILGPLWHFIQPIFTSLLPRFVAHETESRGKLFRVPRTKAENNYQKVAN